jgi:hypothetical protein
MRASGEQHARARCRGSILPQGTHSEHLLECVLHGHVFEKGLFRYATIWIVKKAWKAGGGRMSRSGGWGHALGERGRRPLTERRVVIMFPCEVRGKVCMPLRACRQVISQALVGLRGLRVRLFVRAFFCVVCVCVCVLQVRFLRVFQRFSSPASEKGGEALKEGV